MIVLGKVTSIIYQNEQNGYTVMLVRTDDKTITAVGDGTNITVGDRVELEGEYTRHKEYGMQFAFKKLEKQLPSGCDALVEYIAESKIKGLGRKTALKIVNLYGDETLDIIRFHPEKIMMIKGLNDEKAYALSEFMNDEWERWNLATFLSKHDISLKTSARIYDTLGKSAFDVIKKNPYKLLEYINGIDFHTVDKLGAELEIDRTSIERIVAGINYVLSYMFAEGHTCVTYDVLVDYVSKTLSISDEYIQTGIDSMKMDRKIVVENTEYEEYVYKKSVYDAEKNIATQLINLTKEKCKTYNLDKLIDKVSERQNIVLSEKQVEAVKLCINSNLSVLTGGPGTGKTTIIKSIIDILKEKKISYCLAAPTGRAAKRITETTKEEAKTLHRLLEISKLADDDIDSFASFEVSTIDAEVVIVDEASMIDTLLMNNLIKGIKCSSKLILVGDADQLPSVGAGSVLKDIIDSKIANTIFLKEIYRQSATSDIILSSHKVKEGIHFDFSNKETDMYMFPTSSIEETGIQIKQLITKKLKEKFDENIIKDLQVISPIKKTGVGTIELNKMLQEVIINPTKDMVHKSQGNRTFYINDKVMQIKNNYDIEYELQDKTWGKGIYNGDIGYVVNIDTLEEYIEVCYDDNKRVKYDFDELEQIEHAYAITVHKSQGSEFNTVIIPLNVCYEKFFARNLIYTAMTRAKYLLIFVGKKGIIDYMIDNTNEAYRMTGLKRKLCGGV